MKRIVATWPYVLIVISRAGLAYTSFLGAPVSVRVATAQ
jgi:hypothetical protein